MDRCFLVVVLSWAVQPESEKARIWIGDDLIAEGPFPWGSWCEKAVGDEDCKTHHPDRDRS